MGWVYFPFHRALSTDRASNDKSTTLRVDTLWSVYNFLTSSDGYTLSYWSRGQGSNDLTLYANSSFYAVGTFKKIL